MKWWGLIIILVSWVLSFKPRSSFSSFTFIKKLFSFSLLSAIRVVTTAYLRLLIFLLAILIPACASSSLAFHMKAEWQYTALTYSFSNLEAVCCSMSSSNCFFFTCIQISQQAGQVAWYSLLFKYFLLFFCDPHSQTLCFGVVGKADIGVFLELCCFFHDPADAGNLISGCSVFSKYSLNIWKFMVHVLLNPALDNFEHYFTSLWDECNWAGTWASLAFSFFGIGMKTDHFPVLWPLLSFANLLAYWVQHFHSIILGFEITQLEFYHLH